MYTLSVYWKNIIEAAMSAQPARLHSHTREDRFVFERRMAAMRATNRRFVHRFG
jgi:hypothetical protein